MPDTKVIAHYEIRKDVTHPLNSEGAERVKREVAPYLRDDLSALNPEAKFGAISFDGVEYAGWVRA